MTELVIGVERAGGIIRDSALLLIVQCTDRGRQLLDTVEPRRGNQEVTSCPIC